MQDPMSELLESVRIETHICARAQLRAPWGFRTGAGNDVLFYVFLKGSAYLEVHGTAEPLNLGAGDYVMLPHGVAHTLKDSLTSPVLTMTVGLPANSSELRSTIRFGGEGSASEFIGGHLRLGRAASKALLRFLPDVLYVPGDNGRISRSVRPWLEAGAAEIENDRPGSSALIKRACEMLLLEAMALR